MLSFNSWRSPTSALIIAGMITSASLPIVTSAPASAQLFPSQPSGQGTWSNTVDRTTTIPSGTVVPIRYDKAEKIVVTPKETVPVTLTVAANIRRRDGTILIPTGTQVSGKIQPAQGGSQFVAEELIFYNGQRQYINASSNVVTRTEQISKGTNTGSILKGTAIGAGAAAAISAITGDKRITALKVLGGAAVGAIGGWLLGGSNKVEVVSINPSTDLDLRLRSDLQVAQRL